ncbi:hypothetical protein C8F04DRAFT_1240686 [Mycena alexandri]|uniref:Uncharacterized protein n=1 Tax=Mycena alexandri TaxID=1745969 RepID=A0AAD6WT95_9AGAR|nr:hypothetical protein C8F04DRAFT_1240686 [Mycena alexandri]
MHGAELDRVDWRGMENVEGHYQVLLIVGPTLPELRELPSAMEQEWMATRAIGTTDFNTQQRTKNIFPDDVQDCNITAATIHSVERNTSIVVNSSKSGMRSVQSIDIPAIMPCGPFSIPVRFTPRTVYVLPSPKSCYASHGALQSLGADGATLREVILSPDGRLVISSTSIDRDRGQHILGVDSTTSHIVRQPLSTLRASYHTFFAAVRQSTLALVREDDGCRVGGAEKFLELSLPAERMPVVGRTVAFDDVYGIVLTFEQGRLFVVQY